MTSKLIALAKVLFRPSLAPAYTRPLNGILIGGGTVATSADEIRTKKYNGTIKEHHQQERDFLLYESLVKRKNSTNSSNNYNQVVRERRGSIQEVTKEYYRSVITGNDKKNIWSINLTL